ncbi:MAG: peptidylprolyl isomerase [Pseudomonadota bacterium]
MASAAREPLLHFFVIACAIFAIDAWVLGTQENPREIVVDSDTYQELLDVFKEGQSRLPTEAEMGAVLLQWSENEVLYREAQRMGLDKGDEMIRSRLILKIRNVLFSNVIMPNPSEQDLRDWLENNRERYDRPAMFDFVQTRLDSSVDEAEAQVLARRANADELDATLMENARRYQRRPARNLEAVFDAGDAQAMIAAPGTWLPVRSPAGLHLARITKSYPGLAAEYDNIRGKLAQDWGSDARQKELADALQAIVKDYEIKLDLDSERVRESLQSQVAAVPATAVDK